MAYDNVKEVDCLDVSKEGTESWDAACKRYLTVSLFNYLLTAKSVCQLFVFIGFCY